MTPAILAAIATYGPAVVVAVLAGLAEWKRRQARRKEREATRKLGIADNAITILTTAIEAGEAALPREERTVKRIVEAVTPIFTPEHLRIDRAITDIDLDEAEVWLRRTQ